jgi:outer membrane autotransporter protein
MAMIKRVSIRSMALSTLLCSTLLGDSVIDFTGGALLNGSATSSALGQTFVATQSGTIDKIELEMAHGKTVDADTIVGLFNSKQTTLSNMSSADVSLKLKSANINITGTKVTITLDKSFALKKDSNYTIGITKPFSGVGFKFSSSNPYAHGQYLTALSNNSSKANYDLYLKMYIKDKQSTIADTARELNMGHVYVAFKNLDNYTGNNSDITLFKNRLENYSGADMINRAKELLPLSVANSATVANSLNSSMSSVVSARQSGPIGQNSGDTQFSDRNFWIKPFGSKGKQDDKDGKSGFDSKAKGIAFGIDGEYESSKRVGIALFMADTEVDTNNITQSNSIKSYTIVGYGNNLLVDNRSDMYYQIGATLNQNKSTRDIELIAKSASAEYNSYSLFGDIKATRDYTLSDTLKLTPEVGFMASYFKNSSYTESGAGGMNLSVESFDSYSLVTHVGTSATYSISDNISLLSKANISYDFVNKENEITSSYEGGSFATKGLKNDPFGYEVGVGSIAKISDMVSIDFNYDYSGKGKDYTNHALSAKATWEF